MQTKKIEKAFSLKNLKRLKEFYRAKNPKIVKKIFFYYFLQKTNQI